MDWIRILVSRLTALFSRPALDAGLRQLPWATTDPIEALRTE